MLIKILNNHQQINPVIYIAGFRSLGIKLTVPPPPQLWMRMSRIGSGKHLLLSASWLWRWVISELTWQLCSLDHPANMPQDHGTLWCVFCQPLAAWLPRVRLACLCTRTFQYVSPDTCRIQDNLRKRGLLSPWILRYLARRVGFDRVYECEFQDHSIFKIVPYMVSSPF